MRADKTSSLKIIAPGLIEQVWNEAEVLGSVVWLWMHSKHHKEMPLHTLPTMLLPAIKHRKFVLGIEEGKPVFYLSWANLSMEAEQRYLQHPLAITDEDWRSGDRMWILDWVAPFGHSKKMSKILEQQIFANRWMRALYHRGNERGLKIKTFCGMAVMPEEAREWFDSHPVQHKTKNQDALVSLEVA